MQKKRCSQDHVEVRSLDLLRSLQAVYRSTGLSIDYLPHAEDNLKLNVPAVSLGKREVLRFRVQRHPSSSRIRLLITVEESFLRVGRKDNTYCSYVDEAYLAGATMALRMLALDGPCFVIPVHDLKKCRLLDRIAWFLFG